MRKVIIPIVILLAVALMIVLGQKVSDSSDYAGEWYSANGQRVYRFQEGIIYSPSNAISLSDGSAISGAYTFSGSKIVLFAVGVDGLESVKELYLVENKQESLLCENKEGNGKIYFIRSNQSK